ncbi:MAG: hypothetical protein P0Y55_11895 [Candidatus Cohnella colombiensis]|uniref:Uncharacterized protein n=1 Tax=Candidatus Cohnella colombiensis TaxID=3121368 RepID=A0AA95JEI6_9BACL|nr:MAG: hypothetical protein P0Y55_11895 [Cohnella sp.]
MKIKLIKPIGEIAVGTIFDARRMPGSPFPSIAPYQVIDGKYSGSTISISACIELPEEPTYSLAEYTEVHQELLQRREKVKELMSRLEVAEADEKRAVAVADRFRDEVIQLKRERRKICEMANRREDELLKQIDELRKALKESNQEHQRLMERNAKLLDERDEAQEAKKVTLPREVAEAIEYFRERPGAYGNIDFFYHLRFENDTDLNEQALAIIDYKNTNGNDFIRALVNGYTIEQTPWDRFQHGIDKLLEEYSRIPRGTSPIGFAKKIDELYQTVFGETKSG